MNQNDGKTGSATPTYEKSGTTVPEIGHAPWLTRNNEEALRDGWRNFGRGPGFVRFVWDNAEFAGIPRVDGYAVPWNWNTDRTGCGVPGAVKYAGTLLVPPGIGRNLFFVLSTSRARDREQTEGIARIYVDGRFVAGHRPVERGTGSRKIAFGPESLDLVCEKVQWMDPAADQAWVELLSPKLRFEDDQRVELGIEYAITGGANHFAVKLVNVDMADDYNFAELFPQDLAYPDHTLVTPGTIRRGEEALVSWNTTQVSSVYLDGENLGREGQRKVRPEQSTDYVFEVGETLITRSLTVLP